MQESERERNNDSRTRDTRESRPGCGPAPLEYMELGLETLNLFAGRFSSDDHLPSILCV